MSHFRQCCCRVRQRGGFALVIAISLMGFLLLLSISLATLTQVETSASSIGADSAKARKNAYLGLLAALGELQTAAGPDQRATATANGMSGVQGSAKNWLGVWNTTSTAATPVWLVSGSAPDPATAPGDPIVIVGEGSLGSGAAADQIVQVSRVAIEEGKGHFAWWIADESMKASLKDGWTPEQAMAAYASLHNDFKPDVVRKNMARRIPMRRAVETALPGIDPEGVHAGSLKNVLSLNQLNGLPNLSGAVGETFHDVTLLSLGLLTNPVNGGLKYNLTGASSDPYGFLNRSLQAYLKAERKNESGSDGDYTGSSTFTVGMKQSTKPDGTLYEPEPVLVITPPADGGVPTPMFPPHSASKGEGYAFYAPILTEFLFRISVIGAGAEATATQGDVLATYLRSDFVYELWNPYPFTLELTRKIDNATLPPFRVYLTGFTSDMKVSSWRDSGGAGSRVKVGEFTVSMGSRVFGQNVAIPPYIERFSLDSANKSRGPAILYPGEVYAGRSPYYHYTPTDDFSRVMQSTVNTGPKWYFTRDESLLSGPTPGSGSWLHVDDLINVEVDGTFDLTIFTEKYTRSNFTYSDTDLTNVQIKIRGIPFSALIEDMLVEGNQQRYHYNAVTDYERNAFQMAVRIRLKDGLDDLEKLAQKLDPRKRVVNWSDIEEFYEISTFGLGNNSAFASLDLGDLFRHDSDEVLYGPESYRFSKYQDFMQNSRFVKLFDVPTFAPVSLDVFRSAYFVDMPAFSFGEKQTGNSGQTINAAFDRYFMTGITDEWNPAVSSGKPGTALPNPNLYFPDWSKKAVSGAAGLRSLLAGQGAAEQLLVNGSFDINSTSVAAWVAALAAPQFVKDDLKTPLVGVILHMPHQPLTDDDITSAKTDSQLAALSGDSFRNAIFTQTIRILDNPVETTDSSLLYRLAGEIVKGILEWREQKGRPFYSMEEFANSGVIKEAIARSNINRIGSTDIPALSPLYISQAKIMGMLSNFSSVRGDTFLIRSYGDVVDQATNQVRATAVCEAVVQRMPGFVNSANPPTASTASLNEENQHFGRRFHIVAFSWLEPGKY